MAEYYPRETDYAIERCAPSIVVMADGHEARMERLTMKADGSDEIRFSWWKDGKFAPRPLDLAASDLVPLLQGGFGTVLEDDTLIELRTRIDAYLAKKMVATMKGIAEAVQATPTSASRPRA